jgi:hypothetical protein
MEGTLKVQCTESQQVTVENFEAMMQKLLQWSMAETQGDPTQVVTLPPILEEEEPTEQLTNTNTNHERLIHDILDKPQYSRHYINPPTRNHHRPQFHSCAFNSCAVRCPITDKKSINKKPNFPRKNEWSYHRCISSWRWVPDGTPEGKFSCN